MIEEVKQIEIISTQKETEREISVKTEISNKKDTKANDYVEENASTKEETKKNSPDISKNEKVLRQNTKIKESAVNGFTEETSIQLDTQKPTEEIKKTFLLKGLKSIERKSTEERDKTEESNGGEFVLASALKSLRSIQNDDNEENSNIENHKISEASVPSPVDPNPRDDVLMRKVDDAVNENAQIRRQSARLSLHNSLEIVPEDKPIETINHTETKNEEDEFNNLIENIKNCNDLESLKLACISSFVSLNKTVLETKAYMKDKEEEKPIVIPPQVILAPPPPPPPGPPPPVLTSNKLVITKTNKTAKDNCTTAAAAVGGANFLMEEIKRKQMLRNQRKSLRKKYETLDNK